jgi:hypothetical protein
MCGKEEKCVHRLLVSNIWMKGTWNSKNRLEESIKMEIERKGGGGKACKGFMWIRTEDEQQTVTSAQKI